MTAAETIQAAIDRLTELREGVGRGEWYASFSGIATKTGAYRTSILDVEEREEGAVGLIVTLHRTIDAQLAILNRGNWHDLGALTLAEAILGGTE